RSLVIGHGDRLLVEPCLRIRRRMLAVEDRDPAEVLARGPEVVHVPLGEHRNPRSGGHQAVRQVPGIVRRACVDAPGADIQGGPEASTGAFIEGPVADDGLGRSRGHSHGRMPDRGAGGSSAVVDEAEIADVLAAQSSSDLDRGRSVHRVRDEPVHFVGRDSGIIEGRLRGLEGQLQLCASGRLRELGGSDAGDGGGIVVASHWRFLPCSATRTWPLTCVPIPFVPVTSIRALELSSSNSLTVPVTVKVSPGKFGAPRRMLTSVSSAWGPAQSVTKRPMRPIVVIIFMMLSWVPASLAAAVSWWTSDQSRVAIAPPATSVAVTGMVISGSVWPGSHSVGITPPSRRRCGRSP